MGSSGIISRVGGSSITGLGEDLRGLDHSVTGMPGPQETTTQIFGIVDEINPTYPRLVKAHDVNGNAIINRESWIELNHSPSEIAEKWGQVRLGFTLRVAVTGIGQGVSANATIIGVEGETVKDPPIENDSQRGLYWIFNPGSF